jgi:hypothetical protein
MNIKEFRAFVNGVSVNIKDAPTKDQWEAIQQNLATLMEDRGSPRPDPEQSQGATAIHHVSAMPLGFGYSSPQATLIDDNSQKIVVEYQNSSTLEVSYHYTTVNHFANTFAELHKLLPLKLNETITIKPDDLHKQRDAE